MYAIPKTHRPPPSPDRADPRRKSEPGNSEARSTSAKSEIIKKRLSTSRQPRTGSFTGTTPTKAEPRRSPPRKSSFDSTLLVEDSFCLDIEEVDLDKEFNTIAAMLTRQATCWTQVELEIEKIALHDDRKLAEPHLQTLQKLVSNASNHSTRLQTTLGIVMERNAMRREKQKELKETKAGAEFFPGGAAAELAQEKEEIGRKMKELEEERAQLEKEKFAMSEALAFVRAECERKIAEEKASAGAMVAEIQSQCDRRLAEGQMLQSETTREFYAECRKKSEAKEAEMVQHMAEARQERERMEKEKAELVKKMADARAENERKLKEEELEMTRMIQKLRSECERKVRSEKMAAEKQLAEGRSQIEEQLRTERTVTDRIMHVLRELPPLQAAMELGDLTLLEEELRKWRASAIPERFGECRGVVEAVLKLAEERLLLWRGVDRTWKDILKETDRLPSSVTALQQQSQRVFRVLKESQLTKMDLRRSDPRAMERVLELLLAWQERAMSHSNTVQRLIVRKVAQWPYLGIFDFADLDICLRLVDRKEIGSEAFLSRAKALVEDEKLAPHELRPLLSHLEAMLFYLKYTSSEDLQLTHQEFRKLAVNLEPEVHEYLNYAERMYPPGSELVQLRQGMDLMDSKNVSTVLSELRKPPSFWRRDSLGPFREIFYQWAKAMHNTFNLLVLPHHTQVVTLLAFQRFLECSGGPHTLIAQVGTGEGKSMIIATLAIYVAVTLRMKVHVVIDDETLLERDFAAFKRVFDSFEVEVPGAKGGSMRPLTAELCVSEERKSGRKNEAYLATRVNPDADVVYCEAKHVQSFYASIARSERPDFDTYQNRILILDEVDALVVDEEPNDVFVYPNEELSQVATSAAEALRNGRSPEEINAKFAKDGHPAASRALAELSKEWNQGKDLVAGQDYVYVKETHRYAKLHAGRANLKAWSLALECRNFQDGLSNEILFQERLFVTSRPRVFRKYRRVLGLSGSIGNRPEQIFLKDTYRAAFFKVPPFLKTCKGSPFHDATPVRLGHGQKSVYVEATSQAQILRLAEVSLDAREKVPVLVIAKDRQHADQLVQHLRDAARSRGFGALSEDVVRSLSRTLYESNPEQWKENLNRATLPLGDGHERCWRITVTDPRGGRGTDYRVDDTGVDAEGGLLLIPTIVPTSRRDWTQFLGRTARQDCRGQFCCILCAADYEAMSKKYKEALPGGDGVIEAILSWGEREAAERIRSSSALYNSGLRMNELCEEVFSRRRDILKDRAAREHLVDACQRLRWMSVREVSESFARLPSFDAKTIGTEAVDLGRPVEPPVGLARSVQSMRGGTAPKVIIFCLDWSASMMSRDTGTSPLKSRFEICVGCITKILMERVRDCDSVGIVGFGPNVQVVAPPLRKAQGGGDTLMKRLAALRPQMAGGTRFYDAVEHCLLLFQQPSYDVVGAQKWVVCLTDGDDAGSMQRNAHGESVTKILSNSMPTDLHMLVITVGDMKATNTQIIKSWTERVSATGRTGRLLAEKDAATISRAFDVVAECLTAEVGGTIEC